MCFEDIKKSTKRIRRKIIQPFKVFIIFSSHGIVKKINLMIKKKLFPSTLLKLKKINCLKQF